MTDLLQLTAELVAIPSESHHEGPITDWLEAELRAIGSLEVTRVGDNVVGRTAFGAQRRVIIAGHTDTVPANGNSDPRIDGDTLWGLGAADMKSGLAVMVDLARTVQEPAVDITYVFYAREEVAAALSGLKELQEMHPDLLVGDLAVLGEPTDAAIEAGCQGTMRFELVMAGARAHTARPWMGRNAVHRLSGVLGALAGYEERQPLVGGCTYREALQAVRVEGGVAGNVVPDEVTLVINHRFAPDRAIEEAEAHVRAVLEPHLESGDVLRLVDAAPAAAPALDDPLISRMIQRQHLTVRAKLGWTDVARFGELGIPAVNFGPGDPTLAHTAEERVERGALERTSAALRDLVSGGGADRNGP